MQARTRASLIGLGIAALVAVSIKLWPMRVPNGNVLLAVFPAFAVGLTAVALVLMYRTARIINFAQIALGAIAAQLFYQLYANKNMMPYGLALVAAIVGGVLMAILVGAIASLLFFRHPRLVMTVVTILFIQLIAETQGRINGIFVEPGEIQSQQTIIGPFPDMTVELDQVPFRFAHFFGLFMLIILTIGLAVFFRKTRFGIAIRASAENADRASLLGINVKMLNVAVWAIVGLLASVSQLAIMPVDQYTPTAFFDQSALLLPLTAAVVARMSSMPIAFFVAFGMVMLDRSIFFATGEAALVQIGLFGVLLLALLFQRKQLNLREGETTSWKATKEVRPTPRELLELPAIKRTRNGLIVVLAVVLVGFPWIVSVQTVNTLHLIPIIGIIGASLVLLTGWSGQISLGQFAIVTMSSFVVAVAARDWGVPFLVLLPLGGAVGAVFALIVGIPALRIRGLFLAVTTFAVAIVLPLFVFGNRFLGNYVPESDVPRPSLLFLHFEDERSFYYLLFGFFFLTMAAMNALRKSRAGRVLIALRDNEDGVQSFGVNPTRTRLTAFALSGFIAGFGGALFVIQILGMELSAFPFSQSINLFILVVIGGVSSILGPILGAIYFIAGISFFPALVTLVTGVAGLVVLMFIPGGLVQIVFGARDAVLRVVAMRQNIVVPSLFADYSPEAWEKRLAPLSQPVQSHGLAALRHDQRYSLPSRVFGKVGP